MLLLCLKYLFFLLFVSMFVILALVTVVVDTMVWFLWLCSNLNGRLSSLLLALYRRYNSVTLLSHLLSPPPTPSLYFSLSLSPPTPSLYLSFTLHFYRCSKELPLTRFLYQLLIPSAMLSLFAVALVEVCHFLMLSG